MLKHTSLQPGCISCQSLSKGREVGTELGFGFVSAVLQPQHPSSSTSNTNLAEEGLHFPCASPGTKEYHLYMVCAHCFCSHRTLDIKRCLDNDILDIFLSKSAKRFRQPSLVFKAPKISSAWTHSLDLTSAASEFSSALT